MMGAWRPFEVAWLTAFVAVAVVITLVTGDNLFGFAIFLSGVLCVVLAAKGSILNYPIGLVNTIGYGYLAMRNGLFGEQWLNWGFYAPMAVIGFLLWRKHTNRTIVEMRRLGGPMLALLALVCAALIAAGGFGLSQIDGQNTPYIDATTNVLTVAATLLAATRFREQWGFYLVLNAFTVIMWVIRWAAGSPDGPLMVLMWSAYFVNAAYGYYVWTKGSRA